MRLLRPLLLRHFRYKQKGDAYRVPLLFAFWLMLRLVYFFFFAAFLAGAFFVAFLAAFFVAIVSVLPIDTTFILQHASLQLPKI